VSRLALREERLQWRYAEGDEVVALDLSDSVYLAINQSGGRLWPVLVAGATREELIATLTGAYNIPAEDAARDVDAFIASLDERDLLVRS
jgi:Coenzyme PQQ synthesis protein D (PqqD)